MRQKFWIPQANSAVRRIVSKCTVCRRRNAQDGRPAWVDFFGPFQVKRGRSCVFTCLAVRAAHSLDTDSCINAVRRFICRRGQVLPSDNGTNVVAAEKELCKALENLDQSKIENKMTSSGFSTPLQPLTMAVYGKDKSALQERS